MTLDCLAAPDAAALPVYCTGPVGLEAMRARLGPDAAGFLDASGFGGRAQEVRLLPGGGGVAGAVLGLGEGMRGPWAFGGLPNSLPAGSTWRLADAAFTDAAFTDADVADAGLADAATASDAVLGWCLGAYRYTRFKPAARPPARLVPPAGTARAQHAAAATWRVRDLINTPPNLLGPAELAEAAQALAARHGGRCSIIEGAALADGFPALAAVGQASPRAPRVAVLEWGAPEAPLVALCGKGVCFDSGGLDLKPAAGMLRMKKDMGGAALVLGVAEMVMRLGLPVRLLVLVGAVENAVAGNAFRPLDVLRTRAGLTVEVGNTDAEGRLVLADLLAFAAEREPELLVDCATLTGAARVALGPDLPALMTSDDSLAATLLAAGEREADQVWRLPLHAGYDSWLDSPVADMNNVAARPMAGAIIGGLFLRRFVPGSMRWAHLDVYAWNDSNRPGRPEGGEAQALRALVATIETLFGGIPGPGR